MNLSCTMYAASVTPRALSEVHTNVHGNRIGVCKDLPSITIHHRGNEVSNSQKTENQYLGNPPAKRHKPMPPNTSFQNDANAETSALYGQYSCVYANTHSHTDPTSSFNDPLSISPSCSQHFGATAISNCPLGQNPTNGQSSSTYSSPTGTRALTTMSPPCAAISLEALHSMPELNLRDISSTLVEEQDSSSSGVFSEDSLVEELLAHLASPSSQHNPCHGGPARAHGVKSPTSITPKSGIKRRREEPEEPDVSKKVKALTSDDQDQDNSKPAESYITLIAQCLLNGPEKGLLLADIYKYIEDNYNYYQSTKSPWRNSVRHNLSVNECFVKGQRAANGRGFYWCIHPACRQDFVDGDFNRRQARRRVQLATKRLMANQQISISTATASWAPPAIQTSTPSMYPSSLYHATYPYYQMHTSSGLIDPSSSFKPSDGYASYSYPWTPIPFDQQTHSYNQLTGFANKGNHVFGACYV